MTRQVRNEGYYKDNCPTCGREVIVTGRQKNKQCEKCYNQTHKKKVYWKGGKEDEDSETDQ